MAPHDGHLLHPDGHVVYLDTSSRGIWLVDMSQLFPASAVTRSDLSSASCEQVYTHGAGVPDVDTLELFHRRTGYTSHGIVHEAVRSQLVTGVRLDWKHFSAKVKRQFKGVRDICAKAKMQRASFPRSGTCTQMAARN